MFGARPLEPLRAFDTVTTADVMAVLLPIWSTRRVTAGRVRQRMRLIDTEEGSGVQAGYWENDDREPLTLPTTEELSNVIKEIRRLEAVVEERGKQISEIAP